MKSALLIAAVLFAINPRWLSYDATQKRTSQGSPAVYVVGAPSWCGACNRAELAIERITRDRADVAICRLDIDAKSDSAAIGNLLGARPRSVPVVVVIGSNGKRTVSVGWNGRSDEQRILAAVAKDGGS